LTQHLDIIIAYSNGAGKNFGFVFSARMDGTEAVFSQLPLINEQPVCIRQGHAADITLKDRETNP